MKAALLVVAGLMLAPMALAQTTDPTVNESDFDTSQPPADDSYLNDTNASSNATAPADPSADPTVSESDFDTSVPSADTSYLDDGTTSQSPSPAAGAAKATTPGFELVVLVGAVALAGLVARARK